MKYKLSINSTKQIGLTSIDLSGVSAYTILVGSVNGDVVFNGTGDFSLVPSNGVFAVEFDLMEMPREIGFKSAISSLSFTLDFYGGDFALFSSPLDFKIKDSTNYYYLDLLDDVSTYIDAIHAPEYKTQNYFTTSIYTSGSVAEGNTIRFGFIDSVDKATRWTSWETISYENLVESSEIPYYIPMNLGKSSLKLRERSSLANLFASQAPTITSIEVFPYDSSQDKIVVTADKNCQVSVYVVAMENSTTEKSISMFSRDGNASAKVHTYYVPKLVGANKVVAIPTMDSYAKDFLGESATSSIMSVT